MSDAGYHHSQSESLTLADAISGLESLVVAASNIESRTASCRLKEIQKKLSIRIIETYDPADRDAFAEVVRGLCECVPDSAELAALFAISASTLYRWRSGEAVPHRHVRAAVKEHLLTLLQDDDVWSSLAGSRSRSRLH